jgi:hypothetical protein
MQRCEMPASILFGQEIWGRRSLVNASVGVGRTEKLRLAYGLLWRFSGSIGCNRMETRTRRRLADQRGVRAWADKCGKGIGVGYLLYFY